MLWDEYYEKLGDWATSTAVSRMSGLESFGDPDEIMDAILTIGIEDGKGATRLLKKAMEAGVRFSGEQLAELHLTCNEDMLNRAILFSSVQFTEQDLEDLYGVCDDEILMDIARKRNIRLPEGLAEEEEPDLSPAESYGCILSALEAAHGHLMQAYRLSITDLNSKQRAVTVMKFACLAEAEPYLEEAICTWELLEPQYRAQIPLQDIRLNIGNSTMWNNYVADGFFANMAVKKQIYRVTQNVERAIRTVRRLLAAL